MCVLDQDWISVDVELPFDWMIYVTVLLLLLLLFCCCRFFCRAENLDDTGKTVDHILYRGGTLHDVHVHIYKLIAMVA